MKHAWTGLILICGALLGSASAQSRDSAFPPAALSAETVAVVNDTHSAGVTDGAETALRAWGQLKVIEDPESADITLRFDKRREREGRDTQNTDANGKPDYSYSMSFSSAVNMKAYVKDADTPFYSTKTDDSNKKAGMACVNDFRNAYRAARQQHQP